MSVHGLISRELLVSLNALHNHGYIQLNCYIIQFCKACCPAHVFCALSNNCYFCCVAHVVIMRRFLFFVPRGGH